VEKNQIAPLQKKVTSFTASFLSMGSFTDSPFTLEIGKITGFTWKIGGIPLPFLDGISQPYGFHVFGCNPEEFFWMI